MNPALLPLIALQGDLKVYLMREMDEAAAHSLAADILDIVAKSPVIKPKLAAAYAELNAS